MKRMLAAVAVTAIALLGLGSTAGAVPEIHPSQGESSTGRNVNGFGGPGFPHCHVLVASDAAPFTLRVFPAHTGHANAGNDIFNADPDCNGEAGDQS